LRSASTSITPWRRISFSIAVSVQNAAEKARSRHDQGTACAGRIDRAGAAAVRPRTHHL
jgi:hypothetical protein